MRFQEPMPSGLRWRPRTAIGYTGAVTTDPRLSSAAGLQPAGSFGDRAGRNGTILEARNLTKRYRLGNRDVDALRGVSLRVKRGEFVALMGPSGSGKSTLLQLLGGLDRPTSGEVVLDGEVVSHLSDAQATRLRREKTGFVFQFFNLIPLLDVYENVALPFTIAGVDPRHGDAAVRIREVIELVDLIGRERNRPDQLSAGEQQRVALARALVGRPAILLADEPTGNLDYATGGEILDELWHSCDQLGLTIILVTHEARAAAHADRVLVVGDGRIRDEIELGRRPNRDAGPLIARLAQLGL
jgi:putative ABC transport system ATP-binding protein